VIDQQVPLGFIGLGKMGVPMARRLIGAGFTVHGANRSQGVLSQLEPEGLVPAADTGEVGALAQIVMTALPDEDSVRLVAEQLLEHARPGQTIIEHSTISPGLARDIASRFEAAGARYLDAPVSGGPAGAEAGKLTVMVGGDSDVLAEVNPVLAAFGDPIRHCGDTGAGQAVKLVNQLLVAIHTSAAAEAAAFGAKMGIDFGVIGEVIGTSFGSSAMLARNLPRFAAGDFAPATPVSLLKKDLSLIHRQAEELGIALYVGRVAQDLFGRAADRGLEGEDMAALYKLWSDIG